MTNSTNSNEIVVRQSYDLQLRDFERGLLSFLNQHDLPTQSLFVAVNERGVVFQNIGNVLMQLSTEKKQQSMYVSKFVAAVASGLFDAALNYLWNETIFELRQRVAQYDYFILL